MSAVPLGKYELLSSSGKHAHADCSLILNKGVGRSYSDHGWHSVFEPGICITMRIRPSIGQYGIESRLSRIIYPPMPLLLIHGWKELSGSIPLYRPGMNPREPPSQI